MRHRWAGLLVLFPCTLASGQGPYWAVKCAGVGLEHITDVKAATDDAVYLTGDYTAGASFLGQTLISQGSSDVLVAKQLADGSLAWVVTGGGSGQDMGLKVSPTGDGDVVVCGQFSGTADLFGVAVNANGGSTDLFVARLSGADGSAIWVRTGGSAAYSDRATGVSVTGDDRVLVAGEFRGEADFDAGTFTSTIDPGTGQPGFDVFVMSYTSTGTAEWLKQGAAKHDDQMADVVVDGAGNAYAYGQYGDTITFDVEHPNIGLNQSFVVKFAPDGSEQWFRQAGGAVLQRSTDAHFSSDGSLYLAGALQGSLTFQDGTPDVVPNTDPWAYSLLRVSASGDFLQGTATGSTNGMDVSALTEQAGVVSVLGSFQCQFSELAAHYAATGIFIAVGEEDLFIAQHGTDDLALIGAQQFGGHEHKTAGGISTLSNGSAIFSGSFEEYLIFPSDVGEWGDAIDPPCGLATCGVYTYCGDPFYTQFRHLLSEGGPDGFVARGLVQDREPYDPFCREGAICDRPRMDLVVMTQFGPEGDEVEACTGDTLIWPHYNIPRYPIPPGQCPTSLTTSWIVDAAWEDGGTLDTSIIWSSGWYWYEQIATNGCYHEVDSIHVTVTPSPVAWVLREGYAPFPDIPNECTYLSVCDTIWLSAVNVPLDATYQWTIDGVPVPGDSVLVDGAGDYVLTVTSQTTGCAGVNCIVITFLLDTPLPNITDVDFEFWYNAVPLAQDDTVPHCSGGCVQGALIATWYVDGVPTALDQPFYVNYETDYGCGELQTYAGAAMAWMQAPSVSGSYPLHVHVVMRVEGCTNDSLVFDAYDTVYIAVIPPPQAPPGGLVYMCAGDTAELVLECTNCTEVEWGGPGIVSLSPAQDTALVDEFGLYTVILSNTVAGASCTATTGWLVVLAEPPPLFVDPPFGQICAGDAATLYTTASSLIYQWTGPNGPLVQNNDSVSVTDVGAYYLTVYTEEGCPLINGPISVQQFGSPVLQAIPGPVICPGGSVLVQVAGGFIEGIAWEPPLSGGSFSQLITEPGTYTCVVTSCDVEFPLSITIIGSTIEAVIDGTPLLLCGDTVVIQGPEGDYNYWWLPVNVTDQDLIVDEPGIYQVIITDSLGCSDTSNAVTVGETQFTVLLQAEGDSLCEGDEAQLVATGSGLIQWYDDLALASLLVVNDTLAVGAVETDTLYVTQTENDCTGSPFAVILFVTPQPEAPEISGDTLLCEGEDLELQVQPQGSVLFTWNTPQGSVTGQVITVPNVSAADAGSYSAFGTLLGCAGPASAANVVVQPEIGTPAITGNTALCEGDMITLMVQGVQPGSFVWITPNDTITGTSTTLSLPALPGSSGIYMVLADGGPCPDATSSIAVIVEPCELTIPNVFTPNGDGDNDAVYLAGGGGTSLNMRIYNRWGQLVRELHGQEIRWDGRDEGHEALTDGVYYYELVWARAGGDRTYTGYLHLLMGR